MLMQMPGTRDIVIYWSGPDDSVNTLYVDANARPQGHRHLLVRSSAFSVVQKPWGWAHIFGAKAPGTRGGGRGEGDGNRSN